MEEKHEEVVEDIGSASSNSSVDESNDDEPSTYGQEDEPFHLEEPLTEQELEDLVAEFLEVESKAAEAQEALEKESVAKVESEVREELALTLNGDDLETAVADEMATYTEEWERVLDELETECAHLLEQLDGAGIELPSLYKLIETQASNGCHTEAWKKRIHWVGSQATGDLLAFVSDAERALQTQRPVRRRHGKLLEEGASGYLQKKFSSQESEGLVTENLEVDWCSFNKVFSESSREDTLFGSRHWASVYLASTPQQAAEMGLKFPGVDEVEEIDDIDRNSSDPFVAAAIENEKELDLSEEQKKNFRKVKEEDDAIFDRKLQLRLKQKRYQKRCKQEVFSPVDRVIQRDEEQLVSLVDCLNPVSDEKTHGDQMGVSDDENAVSCHNLKIDIPNGSDASSDIDMEKPLDNNTVPLPLSGFVEPIGSKRLNDEEELNIHIKKSRTMSELGDEIHLVNELSSFNLTKSDDICNMTQKVDDTGVDSSPSEKHGKFHCTACDKVAAKVYAHPFLNVIVCADCKCLMDEKKNVKDPDCSECYCGWCGRSADLVSCKSCKTLFCITCIKRNIGVECLLKVRSSGWHCCCCHPSQLQHLTMQLEEALGSGDSTGSSSDSDSDNSNAAINVAICSKSKRKRKKKIRRILDDAELGEDTKKKIAIEKERQERLKSLQVQFSSNSKMMSSSGYCGNLSEGVSVDVLGDAATGYIVNVVREKGEVAVRIPPSISSKLKTHQISGIRFMWENIIQSIRRVKSGDKGLGCILAHTMGLGKTFQVIAFLYSAMRTVDLGLRTALIVTPVNVLHNWRHEFFKWKPVELKPLRIFMLEDVTRERRVELLAKWRAKGGVFLIGYSAFRNLSFGKHVKDRHIAKEICQALQDGPDILVCDEAHMIKNTRADVTHALKQVKCQRRIALTGSPLQNNLMEYYCMVDFVREGFLGSSHEFRNRFQNPIENGQHTNSTLDDVKIMNQRSHILYEQLKGFVQRMDMTVVKKDLPPKTVFVITVKLSALQRKLYKRFLDVHGFNNGKVSSENLRKRSFFAGYQALAQIWNHPGILQFKEDKYSVKREDVVENFLADDSSSDENIDTNIGIGEKLGNASESHRDKFDNGFFIKDWWNGLLHANSYKEPDYSGKMVLLLEILTTCSELGDKALVFSQSIPTLDLIELYLSKLPRQGKRGKFWKKGKDWYRLDGRTESSERQKIVERFNEPENKRVKCCLISTRAGSLGINLHSANRVIIVDGSWNPTYDLQAIYRAWRYGQTKPVFAYRFLAHGTMEEKIYKRQVTKEGLAARVVDRQQVYRTISKEEMLHLFDFGDDENPEVSTDLDQENRHASHQIMTGHHGNVLKQKGPLSHGSCSSDKLMESLLANHHPRWVANFHEHETLLQENEDEKLSKEEQDMAWEVYKKSLEWEEVQKVPPGDIMSEQKQTTSNVAPPAPETSSDPAQSKVMNRFVSRKCTNLSHLLTLRSQGTKVGCSTVCGECAQEISWEELNRESKPVR